MIALSKMAKVDTHLHYHPYKHPVQLSCYSVYFHKCKLHLRVRNAHTFDILELCNDVRYVRQPEQ